MKPRFARETALAVAESLRAALAPGCERIEIAGSLRRRKATVGDVELLYIPRHGETVAPGEMLSAPCDLSSLAIAELETAGRLARRLKTTGAETFGERNKLMLDVPSGIPVDLFATDAASWFNYLVCRTGGAESNVQIAGRAKARGYRWNPYGEGFTRLSDGEVFAMASEADVFAFVGLPYREPWEREAGKIS